MSRRCLICGNINPCRSHSAGAQDDELSRNLREIRRIESRARPDPELALSAMRAALTESTGKEGE